MSAPEKYGIGHLNRVVLIYNILTCEDAKNDVDRTIKELVHRLDYDVTQVPKAVMESAIYCCNMNDEDKMFWHPYKKSFRTFARELANDKWWFDEYYNQIRSNEEAKEEDRYGRLTKARR